MRKIKRGDTVTVRRGTYRGTQGTVLAILGEGNFVTVEGVVVKKHVRANPNQNQPGGIQEKPKPIPISQVSLVNPATGKADRVGFKVEDGQKVRIFKSTKTVVEEPVKE